MPKAEFGSQKHLANAMKSKGLQRLRFWCQVCEKQNRDANGMKMHCQSESHVRKMQAAGQDPKKVIQGFSNEFQRAFVTQLRVSHGEKPVQVNRFYQEYIRDKEHMHMNATKWNSLTEFAKHLGREGIVHVTEDEKDGVMIAWKDTSVEAVRRREDIREKEAAEMKNGAGEDKMLERMAKRARLEAEAKAKAAEAKKAAELEKKELSEETAEAKATDGEQPVGDNSVETTVEGEGETASKPEGETPSEEQPPAEPVKISFGLKAKPLATQKPLMKNKNIFKRPRTENGEEKKPGKKVKL